MVFKTNLSYLRRKRKLTQESVADLLDLSPQAIGLYEKGDREPSLVNLIKLARFFQVSIDDLLTKDMRPIESIILENLKYLRKCEGYRQEDMARLLGYRDKSSYCLIESGGTKLSAENLLNISEFFGVSVDDLLKKDLSKEGQI